MNPEASDLLGRDRLMEINRMALRKKRRGLLDETVLEDAAADEPAVTGLLAESVAFPRARIVDPGRARPPHRRD